MRRPICSPGLCIVLLAACTMPNPAYHATQGHLDSSSGDSLSSTSAGSSTVSTSDATGSGGSSATDPSTTHGGTSDTTAPASTGTTAPVTTAPDTTTDGDTLATSSSDSDATASTTIGDTTEPKLDLGQPDLCSQVDAPTLAVTVQHSPAPQGCNAPLGPIIQGVLEAKPSAGTYKVRACNSAQDCVQGNTQCLANQTITVHVDAPATHLPDIAIGTCLMVGYVGTGFADPNTCNTRIVRFARPGNLNNLASSLFVAAAGVGSTELLPAPWPEVLEFGVEADLVAPCAGNTSCGSPPGSYELVGQFVGEPVVAGIAEAKPAKIPLFDQNHDQVETIAGSFYNLRSWAAPPAQCEFRWLWLADAFKP
ncbi:hypothetical protein [Nannocystis bainbridge]|uniref:Uncharacterized protein n=1 Tax=Nannocystis bainbridge TaxID=2995303 RepID=A0ABT5E1D8_9BACT|nr:hypothetical protein [Nannocystis bainbridge]MDC0719662.1 hypothetical protein [Nannocystis bainbridge]